MNCETDASGLQILITSIGHSLQIALGVILAFIGMDIIHSGGPDDPDGFA